MKHRKEFEALFLQGREGKLLAQSQLDTGADGLYFNPVTRAAYEWFERGAERHQGEPECGNCGASTGQSCNDKGCGYLEAGNGAPVERDERAEFKAWFATTGLAEAWGSTVAECLKGKGCCTNSRWEAWQARATLERKP